MSDRPVRIQLARAKGWRMPPNAVKVDRSTRWGNPFDFRSSEYSWAALSFGCRADPAGRQEASVRAFREWIDPPDGRQMLRMERQPKLAGPGGEMDLGPRIEAGKAPSRDEVREALRGKNLACWCKPGAPCHADVLLAMANR